MPTSGGWHDMVVHDDVRDELMLLEERCRSREQLVDALSPPVALPSAGVRILFSGASGTGKTLAAPILAARLPMDLYALKRTTSSTNTWA